ncbi:MAG: hypothetical protein M1826_002076 [Phylliscum demangeonii]|nr:MAG: hypothetical protein M1826_002076 [Phylliscum demangeonii]
MSDSEKAALLGASMPYAPTPTSISISTPAAGHDRGRRFPQAIAHRGYRATCPENTMLAFTRAVAAGADALETDVHLSRDGVVVLSHDASLARCFGRRQKVAECTWSELSTLRTLRAPHEPMARLTDLLRYMATPGLEHLWVLLDIKQDDPIDDLIRLMALAIREVAPSPSVAWKERIVLGCWTAACLAPCDRHLPDFAISHIGYDLKYARQFLAVPHVSFNLLQSILMGGAGHAFLRDARAAARPVFVWTVNERAMMRWAIRHRLDAVVTDDPPVFRDVCCRYDDDDDDSPADRLSWRLLLVVWCLRWAACVWSVVSGWVGLGPPPVDRAWVEMRRAREERAVMAVGVGVMAGAMPGAAAGAGAGPGAMMTAGPGDDGHGIRLGIL